MLQDGIILTDTGVAINFSIDHGATLPTTGNNLGELFYLTSGTIGLYIYNGSAWMQTGSAGGGTSDAGTLTGTTLASNVVNSSLTSTGALTIGPSLTFSGASINNTITTTSLSGTPGTLTIQPAIAIGGSTNGSSVTIQGGTSNNTIGGALNLIGGAGTASGGNGGFVNITGGTNVTSGVGGDVVITGGPASSIGGAVRITGGNTPNSASGRGSDVFIKGGALTGTASGTAYEGSVVLGKGSLSTTATGGYVYIPAIAGAPTGTPVVANYAGFAPIAIDSTNDKMMFYTNGAWHSSAAGSGTVTSVSIVSANGISGSVATATTTPAITISLGAITPTTVAATGAISTTSTISAANFSGTHSGASSGTNTGDNTTAQLVPAQLGNAGKYLTTDGSTSSWGNIVASAAAAGTLTGTTLASNVVTSSLTSLGSLTSLTLGGALTVSSSTGTSGQVLTSAGPATPPTWQTVAAPALPSMQVAFGSSGNVLTSSTKYLWNDSSTTLFVGLNGGYGIVSGGTSTSSGTSLGLVGGDSTATGAQSGNVIVQAGNPTDGAGGSIGIFSASGVGTNRAGGPIQIIAGQSTGTAPAGAIILSAGASISGAAGYVQLAAGGANSSTAQGNVTIMGGYTPGTANTIGGGAIVFSSTATGTQTERFRILSTGDWSVGTSGTAVGTSGQVLTSAGPGAPPTWTSVASGSSGTVTSVSVTTANGVSGTVATATTTPAITITLGAITPSSVAATGTVTGSNLSGTNTGDNTTAQLVPSQTGNAGKYLTTDGTNSSWGAVSAGTATNISGGTTGQIPYQTAPSTTGFSANFTFNGNQLGLIGTAPQLLLGSATQAGQITTNTSASFLLNVGAAAAGTVKGNNITVTGGVGGSSATAPGYGGDISIVAGLAGTYTGATGTANTIAIGGNVNIFGGDSSDSTSSTGTTTGGSVTMQGGAGNNNINSAQTNFIGGNGGNITIAGGFGGLGRSAGVGGSGGIFQASGGAARDLSTTANGNAGAGGQTLISGGKGGQGGGGAASLGGAGGDSKFYGGLGGGNFGAFNAGKGGDAYLYGGTGGTPNQGGTGASGNAGIGGNTIISGGLSGAVPFGGTLNVGGYIVFSTAPTTALVERLRILNNGAWSVGTGGTNTGSSGQALLSTGATTPPAWGAPAAGSISGGTTGQMLYQSAASTTAFSVLTYSASGVNSTIIGAAGSGATPAGNITLQGGTASGTSGSTSGNVTIQGGTGAANSGGAGSVTIQSGAAGNGFNGGNITITTGDSTLNAPGTLTVRGADTSGSTTNVAAGSVVMRGGNTGTTQNAANQPGGSFSITGGQGGSIPNGGSGTLAAGSGGALNLTGGQGGNSGTSNFGNAGFGGAVNIFGGQGGLSATSVAAGGTVTIQGGASGQMNTNSPAPPPGGNIVIAAGNSTTYTGGTTGSLSPGTGGSVTLTAGSASDTSNTTSTAVAGNVSIQGGKGYNNLGTGNNLPGGIGGNSSFIGGTGGLGNSNGGQAGFGGVTTVRGGAGGSATASNQGPGGVGGATLIFGGNGGGGAGGISTGSAGGTITIQGGTGGNGTSNASGAGGDTIINGGVGGTVGTAGAGGNIIFSTVTTGATLVERLRILNNGAWSVGGSAGSSGQVLTSTGATTPPTWQSPTAGAAAAGTLTGTTLASNVVASSLTSVGTLTSLSTGPMNVSGQIILSAPVNAGATSPFLIRSTAPFMAWQNTGAPTDTGIWDFGSSGTTAANNRIALRAVNDANTVQNEIFSHSLRSGTTLGTTTLTAANIVLNATAGISTSAPVASTVSNAGTGSGFVVSSNNASYGFNVTGQPADGKIWDLLASGTQFQLRTVNDANNAAFTAMTIGRSGNTVNGIFFNAGSNEFQFAQGYGSAGSSPYGGQIELRNTSGTSATSKFIRLNTNTLEIVSNGGSAVIWSLTDAGTAIFSGASAPTNSYASATFAEQIQFGSGGSFANSIGREFGSNNNLLFIGGTSSMFRMVNYNNSLQLASMDNGGNLNVAGTLTSAAVNAGVGAVNCGICIGTLDGMSFDSGAVSGIRVATATSGTNAGAALMSFLRSGVYAIKMGLDGNNNFAIGGWSQGNNATRVLWDTSGNQITNGVVRSGSDIRFKKDFEPIENVIEKLTQIEAFTYRDVVHDEDRRVGVSAQSVQAVFPEAVDTDDNGKLSVAYGNLALSALVEYAKAMEIRIAKLEAIIEKLSS